MEKEKSKLEVYLNEGVWTSRIIEVENDISSIDELIKEVEIWEKERC